jgi:DNA-binding MarR family transcriptional regulator
MSTHRVETMQTKDQGSVLAWRSLLYTNFYVLKRLSEEMLAEQNLELSWYEVLLHVSEAKGPITQRDLQGRVMLGQSGLSRVLTRMEAAELIRRCALEHDRRSLSVELTQIGRERLRRAARVHLAGIKRWFGDQLTAQESTTINESLQRVLNNLDATESLTSATAASPVLDLSTAPHSLRSLDALAVLEELEPLAFSDAAKHATTGDVAALRQRLGDLAKHLSSASKFAEADWALRRRIADISPNETLRQVYKSLAEVVAADPDSILNLDQGGLPSLANLLKRRTEIVDAIGSSDQNAIEDLTHEN